MTRWGERVGVLQSHARVNIFYAGIFLEITDWEGRRESSYMQENKVLNTRNLMLGAVTFRKPRPAAGWLTQDG